MLPGAKGEVYPSGNVIRLPGGYHRTKRTFGTLLLQNGRRFDLNDATQRTAGLRAVLALPRNTAPPSAPVGLRGSTGGTFGVSRSEDWQHLPDGQGARLMASPRYRAIFAARRQLTTLQRGERVILYRDGTPDDTGSAQVAALVFNLITSQRKGEKPGVGAPPEAEIRAVALHWKKALRDNRSDAHYRAQIDYEIARYRPATYAPEATRGFALGTQAAAPAALVEAQHRGRPAGQRAEQAQRLAGVLYDLPIDADGMRRTTTARLAQVLCCSTQSIRLYLNDLRAAGQLDTRSEARALAITRVLIKSPAPDANEGANCSAEQNAVYIVPTPENVVSSADAIRKGETPRGGPSALPDCAAGVSPFLAPIDARAAIAEAFDAAGPGMVLNRKRITHYLASNYPALILAPAKLDALLAAERDRRRIDCARTAEQTRIAALTEKQLRAQLASAQRHIANGLRMQPLDQPDDTLAESKKRRALWQRDRKQLVFWQHRHAALAAQHARLIDVALARFDRAALETERQERLLLDWVDEQRARVPAVPRTPVAVHVAPPRATAAGLIARLRAHVAVTA